MALRQGLAALAAIGVVPQAARALRASAHAAAQALRAAVLEEIPAFSASANPDILPELDRHALNHLEEIARLLGGGGVGQFEFVRAHAQRRAEQRFPLEATLHAYRCGHKVLARWVRDAALATVRARRERVISAVADFAIEYTDAISTICAAEYVARTRALTEAEGDRRNELLNILVSGYDESDGRVARLLQRAGYLEQRQSFCVALAQSIDPLEMESIARGQRIVESIAAAVAPMRIRTLVGTRNNLVTAIFSDARRLSGWTAPQSQLAERVHAALLVLGPAVTIGISTDQPATSFIPKALHEAAVALDFATVAERVVQYSKLELRRLLLHRAADYMKSAGLSWAQALAAADAKARGTLVQTLRGLADADMNVQKAARALRAHPNTLYARLQRIHDLTGRNAQRYHDLVELLLAVDCWPANGQGRQSLRDPARG